MDDIKEPNSDLPPEKLRLLDQRLKSSGNASTYETIPRQTGSASVQLSFAQERMWVLNQLEQHSPVYNVPQVIRIRGSLDLSLLRQCLDTIIARHATLRTTVSTIDGQPVQVIAEQYHFDLAYSDLRANPDPAATLQSLLLQDIQRPFDLSRDLMLRALSSRLTMRSMSCSWSTTTSLQTTGLIVSFSASFLCSTKLSPTENPTPSLIYPSNIPITLSGNASV